jgi:hypothetical protein
MVDEITVIIYSWAPLFFVISTALSTAREDNPEPSKGTSIFIIYSPVL